MNAPVASTAFAYGFSQAVCGGLRTQVGAADALLRISGALWLEAGRALVVADLHLEKGSSYASRGQMLPPYDTAETLRRLAAEVAALSPAAVILLGDTFHDRRSEDRLAAGHADRLRALAAEQPWWTPGTGHGYAAITYGWLIGELLRLLDDIIVRLQIPTQGCVLTHVTTTLGLIGRGAPVDLVFQSIGGTQGVNESFGVTLGLLAFAPLGVRAVQMGMAASFVTEVTLPRRQVPRPWDLQLRMSSHRSSVLQTTPLDRIGRVADHRWMKEFPLKRELRPPESGSPWTDSSGGDLQRYQLGR